MGAVSARIPLRLPRVVGLRLDLPAIAAFGVPALLLLYLGLNNGGYDVIPRSQAGIIVWWVVIVLTTVGALPVAGGTRAGRVLFVLLTAFAAWTALSLSWTDSAEQTSVELGRTAAYLGFFALGLALQGEGRWRYVLHGVTAGLALVAAVAVYSRLEPSLFPKRVTGKFLPGIQIERRLAYPLNYSSGLGALAAMGLPLLLAATSSARTLIWQALAAAALPVVALTLWLTTSSLSVPAAVIGLLVFFVLAPDRLPKVATALVAAAGSGILFAANEQRHLLDRGLPTPGAQHQGDEMLVIIIVVCAGVALAQTGIGLAVRYGERPRWMRVSRQQATLAAVVAVASIAAVGIAAGGIGRIGNAVDDFKGRGSGSAPDQNRASQILNFSGSGRYQFWQSAVDQNETAPWRGTGPGTFQFWWSEHGSYSGYVRDTHSLYFQTLGELGIPGLLLMVAFIGACLILGASRCLRAPPDVRLGLAAATAGAATFAAAAAVDWDWQLGVLPAAFLMLAAVIAGAGALDRISRRERAKRRGGRIWLERGAMIAVGALAMVAIALPLASTEAIDNSEKSYRAGQLDSALTDARTAARVQPYAATPRMQEALILEVQGRYGPAVAAAEDAVRAESTNWRPWFILSRLQARNGNAKAAVRSYRHAKILGAPI